MQEPTVSDVLYFWCLTYEELLSLKLLKNNFSQLLIWHNIEAIWWNSGFNLADNEGDKDEHPTTLATNIQQLPQLPDLAMLKIMEYMDTHDLRRNVKPVCKRFNSLATEVVDKRPQGENCDQCELDRVAQRMDNADDHRDANMELLRYLFPWRLCHKKWTQWNTHTNMLICT